MYAALRATTETLTHFLSHRIDADPVLRGFFALGGGQMQVTGLTPQEMNDLPIEGLSVWLYRVARDESTLNSPHVRVSATELQLPPLPMKLYYLVTPMVQPAVAGSPLTEQEILGKALQAFYSHPVLRGGDLQGAFLGTDAEIAIRLESLNLQDIVQVWQALKGSYQLSVSYEVTVINIEPSTEPEMLAPVTVALPEFGTIVSSRPN